VIFNGRGRTRLDAMTALWAKIAIRDVETREQIAGEREGRDHDSRAPIAINGCKIA